MQSSIYNFYCLNTIAKHFYRLNPTLTHSKYKLSLTSDITVSSVFNIIPIELFIFKTEVQSKNKKITEFVLFSNPNKDQYNFNYKIDIFNISGRTSDKHLELDTSLKLDRFFKTTPKMNHDLWSNLSVEKPK